VFQCTQLYCADASWGDDPSSMQILAYSEVLTITKQKPPNDTFVSLLQSTQAVEGDAPSMEVSPTVLFPPVRGVSPPEATGFSRVCDNPTH
jgi:hypothetical protein